MTTPDTVSVVIRTFNEERTLGRLLSGLAAQTRRADQILVVDSGSTDGTLEVAARHSLEVHHIEPAAFSFGRSLNVGFEAATGTLVVIASAHVYPVYDTWLEHLTAPFADPEVGLAYGRQVGGPTTRFSENQVLATWFPATSNPRQTSPFANNANACVRRRDWEADPYDESLTGLEDLDFAVRVLARQRAIAYVAEAPVVHVHRETWSQTFNRYRREAIAHRRIFHDQRMTRWTAARLLAANIASDYLHAARDRKLARNLIAIPAFRAAQFAGTYEGFSQRGEPPADVLRRFYYPRSRGETPPPTHRLGARISYDDPEPPA